MPLLCPPISCTAKLCQADQLKVQNKPPRFHLSEYPLKCLNVLHCCEPNV